MVIILLDVVDPLGHHDGRENLLLSGPHLCPLRLINMIVTQKVQDTVHCQQSQFTIYGVTISLSLDHGARIGYDNVAQIGWFPWLSYEIALISAAKSQDIGRNIHITELSVEFPHGLVVGNDYRESDFTFYPLVTQGLGHDAT